MRVRAISIKQPWAAAIACGLKTIELRRWTTAYRGSLVVCVARLADSGPQAIHTARAVEATGRGELLGRSGQAIAQVTLRQVRLMTMLDVPAAMHPFIPGYFAWELADATVVGHDYPVVGQQRLFWIDWPDGGPPLDAPVPASGLQ